MRRKLLVVLLLALFVFSLARFSSPVFATDIIIDSYSEDKQETYWVLDDLHPADGVDASALGQSFTVGLYNYTLTKAKFYMRKFGSPTGNAHVVLYAHTGTYGTDSVPTGSPLATSDDFDVSTLTTNLALVTFTFSGDNLYTMTKDTHYCIVFQNPTSGTIDSLNGIDMGTDDLTLTHSGNLIDYCGTGWAGFDDEETIFYVYGCLLYTFHGLFDENSGQLKSESARAVNVTAYFSDGSTSETFEVNGTYTYNASQIPLYFLFDLGDNDREYWLTEDEYNINISIFNATLTAYTVEFLDLAGALDDYPYVEAQRLINGTLTTVEKRKVDVEKKVQFSLKQGIKYTLIIKDGADYTFGDLLFTDETEITLTLKGIEFPQNIILGYQYVRIYSYRHDNLSSISICYQDLRTSTNNVVIYIKYENGTLAYNTTQSSNSFNVTWSNAQFNLTYYVQSTINHVEFGEMHYNLLLHGGYSDGAPWHLPIGSIPYFTISNLLPIGLVFAGAVIFSKINAPLGAFVGCVFAILMYWWGWVIPPNPEVYVGLLVAGMFFSILFGIAHSKKKVYDQ